MPSKIPAGENDHRECQGFGQPHRDDPDSLGARCLHVAQTVRDLLLAKLPSNFDAVRKYAG
jgi:hypothetical protein